MRNVVFNSCINRVASTIKSDDILLRKGDRFIYVNLSPSNVLTKNIKPSLFYDSKHITYVLHHESGDGGNGVYVVLGMVGEADAGHQI